MSVKKKKLTPKKNITETGLLVVEPVELKRKSLFSLKSMLVILFTASVFVTAFFAYKKGFPLLKSRIITRSDLATRMDPYQLVKSIKERLLYSVVDTRDVHTYRKGHIKWAIPASELKMDASKKFVLYGATQFDLKPIELAEEMANKGMNVKVLAIGWNEFRHFSNLWVPADKWEGFNISEFVEDGAPAQN